METKKWYQSVGLWGGIIAFVATVAGMFGIVISAEEQSTLATHLSTIIEGIVALVGIVLGVYGRIKATKAIQ